MTGVLFATAEETLPGVIASGVIGILTLLIGQRYATARAVEKVEADNRVAALEQAAAAAETRIGRLRRTLQKVKKREQVAIKGEMQALKASGALKPTGFYLYVDIDTGVIVDASDGVRDVLGWRSVELKGRPMDILLPEKDLAAHHAGIDGLKSGRPPRSSRIAVVGDAKRPAGDTVPVTVVIEKHPLPTPGGNVYRAEIRLMGGIVD